LKAIPLTLMAVASLIIATISAKTQNVVSPLLGHDTTIGGTTFHYGPPQITPNPPGTGKWIPFPVAPFPDAPFFYEQYSTNLAIEHISRLNALVTPSVSLPNGVVVGAGKPTFNHDGQAYAGLARTQTNENQESTISDELLQRNLSRLQYEYEQNIKSGKWHKFVNGE
jgi:hypothetical protein